MTAHKIVTCLWFHGDGEEAAHFYTSLIPDSAITGMMRPEPEQPALVIEFTLAGTPYQILNGGPHFTLDEAASIVVQTEDQTETDRLWAALTADGGSESMCGWCKDRFGVSWQIVPKQALALLSSPDQQGAARAMEALLKMQKIDIATLEAAHSL